MPSHIYEIKVSLSLKRSQIYEFKVLFSLKSYYKNSITKTNTGPN